MANANQVDSQVTGMEDDPLCYINDLPDEILLNIFAYLPAEDLGLNIQFVCSRWYCLSSDDTLWKDSSFSTQKNPFISDIPSVLQKMPKLQCFHAVDSAPEVLHKLAEFCKDLRKLVVSNFLHIKGGKQALKDVVTECSRLEELTVPGVTLANARWAPLIGQCANLRAISLTGISFQPINLKHVADGCPSLQYLDMGWVNWCYHDMKYFLLQKKNRIVSLRIVHVSDEGVGVFPLLPICKNSLHNLELSGSLFMPMHFEWSTFSIIKTLSCIKSLKITNPSGLSACAMENLFLENAFCQLLELKIEGSEVNSRVVHSICNNCKNILKLKIASSCNLTDDGLEHLYMCLNLEELHLYECISLTSTALDHVMTCNKLKHLSIVSCKLLQKGLAKLTNLPELRHLNIDWCDAGLPIDLLPLYKKKLRRLSLHSCVNIDSNTLAVIHEMMPLLIVSL